LERYEIPLSAIYCGTSFTEPTQAKDDIETVMRQANRSQKLGATTIVLQAGRRQSEPYTQWCGMANAFNEIARQAADIGMITTLHPHTGTLIEKRTEIDAILNAVDSDMVFFAPDTGQIAKAGDDAIEALRTYKSLIRHVHLKDYGGGKETGYAGYNPFRLSRLEPASPSNITPLISKRSLKDGSIAVVFRKLMTIGVAPRNQPFLTTHSKKLACTPLKRKQLTEI